MMCAPACAFFSFLLFNAFEKSSVFSRTKTLNRKGHFFPRRLQTSFSTTRAQRERERQRDRETERQRNTEELIAAWVT